MVPLYYQIQRHLLEQIRSGVFKPGESLPSEQEIAERLGVSRMTGRHALKSLRDLGLTYSIRGKGTFVSAIKLEKDFRQVLSFTEEMQARGVRPTSKAISFSVVPADQEATSALQLSPREKVISLRRIRYANSLPVGIEWSRIPLSFCPGMLETFDPAGSLYAELETQYGIRLSIAEEVILAGLARNEDARLLKTKAKSPVFLFTRVSYTENGAPAEFVKSVYRADRYKIVNRLTRVDRGLLAVAR